MWGMHFAVKALVDDVGMLMKANKCAQMAAESVG
jgi:hypothetical protein